MVKLNLSGLNKKQARKKLEIHKRRGSLNNSLDLSSILQTDNSLMSENSDSYIRAEMLLEYLNSGANTLGNLSTDEKYTIFTYLNKFTIFGRIVELFTKLPLSSIMLQKPSIEGNQILEDYIYYKFNTLLSRADFKETLYKTVSNYWTYGIGAMLIEDDYEFDKDTVIDFGNISKMVKGKTESSEQSKRIEDILNRYKSSPDTVSSTERLKVVNSMVQEVNRDYKGMHTVSSLNPHIVLNRKSNTDINYSIYTLPKSAGISRIKSIYSEDLDNTLQSINYSKAKIRANNLETDYLVDTDPYNSEGQYIVSLERQDINDIDNSIINRAIEPAIDYISAKKRQRTKINQAYKVVRLISTEDNLSGEDLDTLQNEINSAADAEEGYNLVTNMKLSIEHLSLDAREQIDMSEALETALKEITTSLGVPESLIGGSDSYGS
ncbi:hypothetical protein ThvES_00019950, partial [Thiovulum sp. ES]